MKEIVIRSNEAGQRFDKFLAKYMKQAPKSFFYKMLRKKNIVLNGKKAAGNEILAEGDTVKLFLSDETIAKFSGKEPAGEKETDGIAVPELDIIYEDEHTLFINKPAGMLSQKARPEDVSLVEYIIGYLLKSGQISREELRTFHPSVCNRLDRNTSGIVAAGKTLAGLQQLGRMFCDRTMGKYYLCLVDGIVEQPKEIEGWLVKDSGSNQVRVSAEHTEGSAKIRTGYRPVAAACGLTLMEVHLITGKTHQIRAHLAAEGHPLIGDYKYGNRKINEKFRKKYGLTHQLLHAERLCFPVCSGALSGLSGKVLRAGIPPVFESICRDCGIRTEGE